MQQRLCWPRARSGLKSLGDQKTPHNEALQAGSAPWEPHIDLNQRRHVIINERFLLMREKTEALNRPGFAGGRLV